jgi:aspartyl-tRNA(Asn)/glutamyl-tRNA(Gln) amidotransferase subunit A
MLGKTITQMRTALDNNTISAVELATEHLGAIAKHADLNAFITVTHDEALADATAADAVIAAGKQTVLSGIPYAHKDLFCTQGIKTSCGSNMLDNFISPYDAHVVTQLKNAGIVSLGKTNMDEFAMGSSNENSFYGPVKNPWNTKCVPGGSSGGSAAAVAARLVPAATGTDTGGSIRQPASWCGITGIKPTYGRVSRYGMIAFSSSLDQGGTFAQTAEDCAHVLGAMVGFDERDSTCIDKSVPDYTATLNDSLKGKTIGIPKDFFSHQLDDAVAQEAKDAIAEFEKLGATLVDIDLPHNHLATAAYYVIAPAEASTNLSRFDGVRFGHRCSNPEDLTDLYQRSRTEGFGDEVKRRILVGTYALSSGYYDAYYTKAQQVRQLIANDYKKAFEKVDIIMGPTTPMTAFEIGQALTPVELYLSDIYTVSVNLAGLPGMTIPAGFVNNMPMGLQLIGQHFDEATLLNFAHQFQQITDWHTQKPEVCA